MNEYQQSVNHTIKFLEEQGINPQKVTRFTIIFEAGRMPEMQVEFIGVDTESIFANYTLTPKEYQ